MTALFAGNPDVAFGDVNLSEDGVGRGPPHNPGGGGWPTIRYFNAETGIEGGSYEKLTSKPMCEELGGDGAMLQDYIEGKGNTSLCDVDTKAGCDEREAGFIDKITKNSPNYRAAQLERLRGMEGDSMKPELKDWITKRRKILEKLAERDAAGSGGTGGDEL